MDSGPNSWTTASGQNHNQLPDSRRKLSQVGTSRVKSSVSPVLAAKTPGFTSWSFSSVMRRLNDPISFDSVTVKQPSFSRIRIHGVYSLFLRIKTATRSHHSCLNPLTFRVCSPQCAASTLFYRESVYARPSYSCFAAGTSYSESACAGEQ
jgi:hypothetical protein